MLLHRRVQGLHGGGSPVADNGESWTGPVMLSEEDAVFYLMNARLIETTAGRLLVPVAVPAYSTGYYEGAACSSGCFYSDDGGVSWQFSNKDQLVSLPDDPRGMAEPGIVELRPGELLMLCRTGKGYLYQARSYDSGITWSAPQKTSLLSPCSSFALSSLADGRIIVLYNHAEALTAAAFFPRNPLVSAISEDGGQTWLPPVIIDQSGLERDQNHLQHIYPSLCQMDGELLLCYTTHPAPVDGQFKNNVPKSVVGGLKTALVRI